MSLTSSRFTGGEPDRMGGLQERADGLLDRLTADFRIDQTPLLILALQATLVEAHPVHDRAE
ncbi:MAG: hypothetical protein NVS9B11_23390 [Candidatus Dormibacteraceae bacterium]